MEGLMMNYPLTVSSILDHGYRVYPKKEFISILPDKSRHSYTFADLYKRSKKLMHALLNKLDIKPGDIIGTYAWNHYQHMELYYGIPGSRAVCHTINIRLSQPQTEYIINNAEDRYIFIDVTLVPLLEPIAALLLRPMYRNQINKLANAIKEIIGGIKFTQKGSSVNEPSSYEPTARQIVPNILVTSVSSAIKVQVIDR